MIIKRLYLENDELKEEEIAPRDFYILPGGEEVAQWPDQIHVVNIRREEMTLQDLLIEFDKRRAEELTAFEKGKANRRLDNLDWAITSLIEILKDKDDKLVG